MNFDSSADLEALVWLRRLQPLPLIARRAALGLLSLRRPDATHRVRRLLAMNASKIGFLDRSPHTFFRHEATRSDAPSPVSREMLGARLGAWRIRGILGRGGMGTVYLAQRDDGAFEREVALKCMHAELSSEAARIAFRKERNALAALNHRDIVPILDSGVDETGAPWFVMPIIHGQPIVQWSDDHRLAIRQRVTLIIELCQALGYAHKRGILHQDVKASAVLIAEDGHPKLLDFGLAEVVRDSVHGSGKEADRIAAYTLGYAAPELLRGAPPSTAIDIYAVGALLHLLLCSRWPSSTSNDGGPLSIMVTQQAQPPSRLARELTVAECQLRGCRDGQALSRVLEGDLDCIALKCVAQDPEQRYESIDALRDDLQRWLEKRPISLRKAWSYRLGRHLQRNARLAAMVFPLVILLCMAGAIATWQMANANKESQTSSRVEQVFSQSLSMAALSHGDNLPIGSRQLLTRTEASFRQLSSNETAAVLARGLSILARSQTDAGNYGQAEKLALESSTIGEASALQFAFNQTTLARLHNLQARHAEAYRDSKAGLKKIRFGMTTQDKLATAVLQTQLALAEFGLGRGKQAESTLGQAIASISALESPQAKLELARMLVVRGGWRRQHLKFGESVNDLNEAMAIASRIDPRVVDDARESLLRTLLIMRSSDREKQAHRVAQDLLASRMKTLGPDHPLTGVAWTEYALTLVLMNETAHAQEAIEKADSIISKTYGRRHPAYATVLTTRAAYLESVEGARSSLPLFEEAYAILLQHYGRRHEFSLEARESVLTRMWMRDRFDEAAERAIIRNYAVMLDDLMALYGEVSGPLRGNFATMLTNVDPGSAEALRQANLAVSDARRQYGEGSTELLATRYNLFSVVIAGESDAQKVKQAFTVLVAEARKSKSLFAVYIEGGAFSEYGKWQSRHGDKVGARKTLMEGRASAEAAGHMGSVEEFDFDLENL